MTKIFKQDANRGRWHGNRNLRALLLLAILWVSGSVASAQVLYGSVTGNVTDKSGAFVTSASVTVRNQDTGAIRNVKTNGSGQFTARDLEPGTYSVSVPATSNFGVFEQQNVAVDANQEVRVNVKLQLSSVSAEIVVTDAPPVLQTDTAEVSAVISSTEIEELPLGGSQGRNFQSLYSLVPGAAALGEANSTAANPSRSFAVNINGVTNTGNTTRVDGATETYGWLPSLIAYVPPADSIKTVNVVTNSFTAEQGIAGGASINIITKSGTNKLHGTAWEYNQIFNTNARGYLSTAAVLPRVPKNIFNQFGFNLGGPVVIPHLLNGKNKLFFFENFERTTRRNTLSGQTTVPDSRMLAGDFSEVASGLVAPNGSTTLANALLYDPQPGGVPATGVGAVRGFLPNGINPATKLPYRPTFLSEYGCNCIPASRQSAAAAKMLSLLKPISDTIGTPSAALLGNQLGNDYFAIAILQYNRFSSDSKINYNISERTSLFGRYSIQPFTVVDPQEFGDAGGTTLDGGQPGAAAGRTQNIGLGLTHVISPNLVIDMDGGYNRQFTHAQSTVDIAAGAFGRDTLNIPGTNGPGIDYAGQPVFAFTGFTAIGNSYGSNPFRFRDNQFTGDVNLSWTLGRHSTRYGFTYYHFDLNHFQPTSGVGINTNHGGFQFQGGLTNDSTGKINAYESLADFLLGLPNNGTGTAVSKAAQIDNPNTLRWTELAAFAQDQWALTPKLTLSYGVRYEFYPTEYRDHEGISRLDPTLPQTANVEIGSLGGNPKNAGIDMGLGSFVPRFGLAYRVTNNLVVRSGFGITTDPDSLRSLRDSYPEDLSSNYSGASGNSIAVDASQVPITLVTGIPILNAPIITNGFASLPVGGTTNTAPANFRRGYIESWNLFVEQDLGNHFVFNAGYVGTHAVRQLSGYSLNAAPIPSGTTTCMANGQYNPSSMYFTRALGSNPCNFAVNSPINQTHCFNSTNPLCYNTGGITMNAPVGGSNYNALQVRLNRDAGKYASIGIVYTWSHAFAFSENGAGSGSNSPAQNYPEYWARNRATANYDRTNNLQVYSIYRLPFGHGQQHLNKGVAAAIFGGLQINGQMSHISGSPFSIGPSFSSLNAPGTSQYADLIGSYKQIGGHNRTIGNTDISGGKPWFDPGTAASPNFANPFTPTYTATQLPSDIGSPIFGNTHRNQFRGPGQTSINAGVQRVFKVYHENEFSVRVEAFNALNHALLNNPNTTLGGSFFGYITSFGGARTVQYSGRFRF